MDDSENITSEIQGIRKDRIRQSVFAGVSTDMATNVTNGSYLNRDEGLAVIEVTVSATILFLAIAGNGIVVVSLITKRKRISRMHLMILHLSLADLFVAFFNVLPQLAWDITNTFRGGQFLCVSVKYFQVVAMYASSYVLLATAVDRYFAICHPFVSQTWTAKHAHFLVAIAWTASLVFSLPQVVIFSYREIEISGVYDCWAHFDPEWTLQAYITWNTASIFIVPTCLLGVLYGRMTWVVWKAGKIERLQTSIKTNGHKQGNRRNQSATTRTLFGFTLTSRDRQAKQYLKVKVSTDSSTPARSSRASGHSDMEMSSSKLDMSCSQMLWDERSVRSDESEQYFAMQDKLQHRPESKHPCSSTLSKPSGDVNLASATKLAGPIAVENKTSWRDGDSSYVMITAGGENGIGYDKSNVPAKYVTSGDECPENQPRERTVISRHRPCLNFAGHETKDSREADGTTGHHHDRSQADVIIRSHMCPQGVPTRSTQDTSCESLSVTFRNNTSLMHSSVACEMEGRLEKRCECVNSMAPLPIKQSSFLLASIDDTTNSASPLQGPSSEIFISKTSSAPRGICVTKPVTCDKAVCDLCSYSFSETDALTNKSPCGVINDTFHRETVSHSQGETRHIDGPQKCSTSLTSSTRPICSSHDLSKRKESSKTRLTAKTTGPSMVQKPQSHRPVVSRAKVKTIKLTVTVVICYVLCWAPFFIGQMWAAYDEKAPFEGYLFTIILLLASVNSCTNPWIYSIFSDSINQRARTMCKAPCQWVSQLCSGRLRLEKPWRSSSTYVAAHSVRTAEQHYLEKSTVSSSFS